MQNISFLLPDFHHHVGSLGDHNVSLPALDDDDAIFHSATERSLSPDKASEFLGGNERTGIDTAAASPLVLGVGVLGEGLDLHRH